MTGWIESEASHGGDCAGSSASLPESVTPQPEPTFNPMNQRGSGQPSTSMNNYLRSTGSFSRGEWTGGHSDLLFYLFLFFFPIVLLEKIAWWTTLKATEWVIKTVTVDPDTGKRTKRAQRLSWKNSTEEWSKGKPRLSNWQRPLTAAELLVWIGIRFRMGVMGKQRVSHYWSNRPGHGDPIIRSVMTKNRFLQVYHMYTFSQLF